MSESQRDYYEFMSYESETLKRRYTAYADPFTPGGLVVDIDCGRGEFLHLFAAGLSGPYRATNSNGSAYTSALTR